MQIFRPEKALARKPRNKGFSLVEALVMVIIAGSCMVPILGTLQHGAGRTQGLGHKARMRVLCESKFNEAMANVYFEAKGVPVGTSTLPWPPEAGPDAQIATYIVNVALQGNLNVATVPGGLTPSPVSSLVVATQPKGLRELVITVSLQNDDPDSATESIAVSSLVAFPTYTGLNRIFVSDPGGKIVYAVDPFTRKLAPQSIDFDPVIPGGLAPFPNNLWLGVQCKAALWMVNLDQYSPDFGGKTSVYSKTDCEFLPGEAEGDVRKGVGMVFRPDGRYCYVSAAKDAYLSKAPSLMVFEVPTNLPAPLKYLKSLPSGGFGDNQSFDMRAGEDGWLYVARNNPKKIYRLPMLKNPASYTDSDLMEYIPSYTWTVAPQKVTTSRTGREVLSYWPEDATHEYAWSSSWDPASVTIGGIGKINSAGPAAPDENIGLSTTMDGRWAIFHTKKDFGGKMFYAPFIRLPPRPSTTISGGNMIAPNEYIQTSNTTEDGAAGFAVISSPQWKEAVFARDAAGRFVFADIASAVRGLTHSGVPDPYFLSMGSKKNAWITARQREEILVGTSDGGTNHQLVPIDLYAMNSAKLPWVYEDRIITLAGKPISLSFDGAGSLLSVATGGTAVNLVEMALNKVLASDVTTGWAASTSFFLLDGGFLSVRNNGTQYKVFTPRLWPTLDASPYDDTTASLTMLLPPRMRVVDAKPLNDGGAMVLATTWATGTPMATDCTLLTWIGPDYKVWASWSSLLDQFPPQVATKLAISADDSLLALFTPNLGNGGPYVAEIFDLRAQNFASLTQQFGLISDIRDDDEANFAAPPYVTFKTPGPALVFPQIKLSEAFTASDSYMDARNYPGNYKMAPGGKYSGHANRFFGYYYPATSAQKLSIGHDDMGRFFLDGVMYAGSSLVVGPGFATRDYSAADPAPNVLPIHPPRGARFQLEHGEGWSDGFSSFFATTNAVDPVMGANTSSYGLITPTTGVWGMVASTSFRPMRFTPPSVYQWTSHDDMLGDRGLLVFSRDAAKPTLFVLNTFTGGLATVEWGGGVSTYSLNVGASPVGSGTVNNMMVSPDGYRLILTADFPPASGPHQVFFVDISVPATGTYCSVIATQTLEFAPVSLAMRPFNRLHSSRDQYTELATMAASVCGNSIGAVGDGGIYLAGGANSPGPAGVATNTVTVFSPITGGNINLGEQLATPAMRHGVVAYDGALTLLNGNDGVATRAYVQQWDTRTKEVLPPQDVADITSTRQSPKMADYNNPSPYALACDNYLTKTVWFTTTKYHGWKAMDRDSSTAWYSQDTALPHWLTFDFGKKVLIDRMDLRGCDDYFPIDFELWGSNNPGFSPYDVLLSKKYTKYNIWWHKTWWGGYWECECKTQTFNISNNQTAYQYYKLNITSGKKYDKSASNQIGIREFSLYGYVPSERPVFDHMASTTRDVSTIYTRRAFQGTALTPYGIVFGGGTPAPSGGATTTVGLYWPHVVASFSLGASDLVCWLKFDETSGNNVFDFSYNGRNGTTSSTSGLPAFVPGREGNAISLITGLNQCVTLPPGVVDGLTDFTIACWVNLQSNTTNNVLWYFGQTTGYYIWLTPNRGDGKPRFGINAGGSEQNLDGNKAIPTDGWHHVAFSMSGTTGKMYLDGQNIGTVSTFTYNCTNIGATVGNWVGNDKPQYTGDPNFNGQVDEFVIFNRALTLNEIRALAKTANCIAHLKFDEPLGPVITANDSSALGTNDGTAYNGPTSVAGNFGNALTFNGTNQYLSLPTGIMTGITDFSISCWFQLTAANGNWARLFDFGTGTVVYMMLSVNDTSNRLCFEITQTGNGAGAQRIQNGTSPTVTNDGNWRHVAITFALASGTNYRGLLFLDGVNIATNSAMTITPDALGNTTLNWLARSMYSVDATLTAKLDDFMIFDGALSPASVTEIYSCMAGGTPTPVALTPSSAVGANPIDASHNGSKAIDGNTTTYYVIDKDNLPATLTIDLGVGNDADVTKIQVDNYNTYGATDRCVKSYRLSGSSDGTTWTVLQANQAVTANTNGQIFTFTNGTAYRFYAFCMLTHNNCSDYAGVNEVTLFASSLAPNVQYVPLCFPSFVPVPGAKFLEWGISRELPPLPGPVAGHVFVYHKGRLYRIGGTSTYPTINLTGTYDYFDFNANAWTQITGWSPYNRLHFGACSFGEEIFFFGGADSNNDPVAEAKAWNPQTNKVRTLTSLPTARHSPCAVACGPSIYIFGGTTTKTGSDGNTVYQYAP